MTRSTVTISMNDDNDLNCSYAIVHKGAVSVIIILYNSECAIYNYDSMKSERSDGRYLLFKHYADNSTAYADFLKLIGKMCKKNETSKYFLSPIKEDNRMVCTAIGIEHMISEAEMPLFQARFDAFKELIMRNRQHF